MRNIAHFIEKDALVAEIKRRFDEYSSSILRHYDACKEAKAQELGKILTIIDTLEVKEVDIDKLCEFRKNIGFAYPESASEYQKQLACYRQGIEDVIKAQKGE